jgi:hypothetical protein
MCRRITYGAVEYLMLAFDLAIAISFQYTSPVSFAHPSPSSQFFSSLN